MEARKITKTQIRRVLKNARENAQMISALINTPGALDLHELQQLVMQAAAEFCSLQDRVEEAREAEWESESAPYSR